MINISPLFCFYPFSMLMKPLFFILCFSFTLIACHAEGEDSGITRTDEPRQQEWTLQTKDCKARLIHYREEKPVLKYMGHECPAEGKQTHPRFAAEKPYLEPLLKEALRSPDFKKPFSLTFYSGLGFYGEMSERLAWQAARSSDWDSRKGRPVEGSANGWVSSRSNNNRIYGELEELVAPFKRKIRVSGVEKVLVAPAASFTFYPSLQSEGLSPKAKLPYDCIIWFDVSPLP